MKCMVEYTQDKLPGSMSIIGRNNTEECPGWSSLCTICIIPDQPGRGDRTDRENFHKSFRITEVSSFSMSCSSKAVGVPIVEMSSALTVTRGTRRMLTVAGVVAAIIPIPWKHGKCSFHQLFECYGQHCQLYTVQNALIQNLEYPLPESQQHCVQTL